MERNVTPALESIQRYMIVGMIMFGSVTFGIGGWAATTQLSGVRRPFSLSLGRLLVMVDMFR